MHFKGDEIIAKILKAGEEHVINHSPARIAQEFMKLFDELTSCCER